MEGTLHIGFAEILSLISFSRSDFKTLLLNRAFIIYEIKCLFKGVCLSCRMCRYIVSMKMSYSEYICFSYVSCE